MKHVRVYVCMYVMQPENVLLDKRGRVRLADFGLAKLGMKSSECDVCLCM
jgi:serine/threonine protein kinase